MLACQAAGIQSHCPMARWKILAGVGFPRIRLKYWWALRQIFHRHPATTSPFTLSPSPDTSRPSPGLVGRCKQERETEEHHIFHLPLSKAAHYAGVRRVHLRECVQPCVCRVACFAALVRGGNDEQVGVSCTSLFNILLWTTLHISMVP